MPFESPIDRDFTRVDQPHLVARHNSTPDTHGQLVGDGPQPQALTSHERLMAIAGYGRSLADERRSRHAEELTQQLGQKYRQLSLRESEFNARAARLESELRTARLLCRERESDLAQRKSRLDYQLERVGELQKTAEQSLIHNRRLAFTESELNEPSCHLAADSATDFATDAPSLGETWSTRLRNLEEGERLLQSQLAELSTERNELQVLREQVTQSKEEQSAEWDRLRVERESEWQEQVEQLKERTLELERRNADAHTLQEQLKQRFQAAAELRLSAEQLIAQLDEEVADEIEMDEIEDEVKQQLAEEFLHAQRALDKRKAEIGSLIQRLDQHHQTIRTQRDEVRGWAARRQQEIGQQAAQLRDRESQLAEREAELRNLELDWNEQRRQYELEIQRLRRLT